MKRTLSSLFWLFVFMVPAVSQKTQLLHFYVEAGQNLRVNTPVSIDLEGVSKIDTLSYLLYEKVKGAMIEKPFQVEAGYVPRLWWILDGTTKPGTKREFYLYSGDGKVVKNEITSSVTPDNLVLKRGNSEILHYRTSIMYPPPKVDTAYKRNGFIHPLLSPSGNTLTMVSPADHYHHVGIWNPWTVVKIGDHVTDFWNLYSKQGTVRYTGMTSQVNGPVFGGFTVKQDHIDFQGKQPEELAINELWDIRVWNTDPVNGLKAYILDLTSFLSVAGNEPIIFEAYRYGGGVGIRTTPEWNKDNSTVLTSEGKTRKDADGTRARWTDLNGTFSNGSTSGMTFFSHPSNREHPEPMRVWPENQNGRGDLFFEFCPIRLKSWVLEPGQTYRLKYRVLVYDGKIDKATAERVWSDFAVPPRIIILNK